jgi:hypothetical protein
MLSISRDGGRKHEHGHTRKERHCQCDRGETRSKPSARLEGSDPTDPRTISLAGSSEGVMTAM